MFNLRGRYPLTLAMLETDQVKKQEVIGVYRFGADSGAVHCLDCWETLLTSVYAGRDDLYEIEMDREYITPINFLRFDEAQSGDYGPYLSCSECCERIDTDTFGIRADLWQCESCGCDVYAYIIGPETCGKKVCRACYERLTT